MVSWPVVRPGVEALALAPELVRGAEVGLVCNQASVASDLTHSVELLRAAGASVSLVFTPEHGLWGCAEAGEAVEHHCDEELGVQVVSLYGELREPPRDLLESLDLLVYDLQDVGARWYTFVATLYHVLKSAGKAGTLVLVADRPNPVTGSVVEGPSLDPSLRSFVGVVDVPTRYGLTPGELAYLLNSRLSLGADVRVLRMSGWRRSMWFDETGLQWVAPSPNLPTPRSALVYHGTCIFEGTNLSEGRGTTKPFELIGAPWLSPRRVLEYLGTRDLGGAVLRPTVFKPRASKYAGQLCRGFQVHVYDRDSFKPLASALTLLEAMLRTHEEYLEWVRVGGRYWIDLLIGRREVRERLEAGEGVSEFYRELEEEALKSYERVFSKLAIYG